jgi:hypothetical protein
MLSRESLRALCHFWRPSNLCFYLIIGFVVQESHLSLGAGHQISPERNLVETPLQIGMPVDPALTLKGSELLVLWSGLEGVRYRTEDWTLLDPVPLVFSSEQPALFATASNGRHRVIVWGGSEVVSRTLFEDGSLSPPQLLGTQRAVGPGWVKKVDIASDGTNFLVVWNGAFIIGSPRFQAARLDSNGLLLEHFYLTESSADSPAVDFDGRNYVVIWRHVEEDRWGGWTPNTEIRARRISPEGPLEFSSGFLLADEGGFSHPGVVSNLSGSLAAWHGPGGVWASFIPAEENAPHRVPELMDIEGQIVLATDGQEFLLALVQFNIHPSDPLGKVAGLRIQPHFAETRPFEFVWPHESYSGNSLAAVGIPGQGYAFFSGGGGGVLWDPETMETREFPMLVRPLPSLEFSPVIAACQEGYLLAWRTFSEGVFSLWAARVDRAGAFVDAAPTLVARGVEAIASLTAASNGRDFLLVWESLRTSARPAQSISADSDVLGARLSAAAELLNPLPLKLSNGSSGSPAAASNGQNYFVVWEEGPWRDRRIVGCSVAADGAISTPAMIAPSDHQQLSPAIASDGTGYLAAWSQPFPPHAVVFIFGAEISADGIPDRAAIVSTGTGLHLAPKVASTGSGYMLAWAFSTEGVLAPAKNEIRASRWQSAQDPINLKAILLSDTPPILFVELVAMGEDYLALWPAGTPSKPAFLAGARVTRGHHIPETFVFPITPLERSSLRGFSAAYLPSQVLVVMPKQEDGTYWAASRFLFDFERIVVKPSEVILSWPVVPGKQYQIQRTDDLSSPAWTILGGPFEGAGLTQSHADGQTEGVSQRFYRVIELPE